MQPPGGHATKRGIRRIAKPVANKWARFSYRRHQEPKRPVTAVGEGIARNTTCSPLRKGREKRWTMHIDYKNPWVQQLRDRQQQAAPREQLLARIDAAERLIASVDVDQHYQSGQVLEHLDHDDELDVGRRPQGPRPRPGARPAPAGRRSVRRRRAARRRHGRAGLHGRRAGPPVQRLDQDHLAVARAGPGEPPAGVRRPQARRLPAFERRPLRAEQRRARRARRPVQPADRRAARTSSSTTPAKWPPAAPARRRSPAGSPSARGRSVETIRAALEQHDLDNPEPAIFPALGGPLTEVAEAERLPGVPPRRVGRQAVQRLQPHEDHDLPRDQRGPRRADHGAAAGLHRQPAVQPQGRRQRDPGRDAREPTRRRASRGARRACRRTWPACTRCRCSPASRSSTCSASTTT